VSALRHDSSPAGLWLANVLLDHLQSDRAPSHSLQPQTWVRLKQQINAEELRLAEREWDFRPDRENVGVREGWHHAENSAAGWNKIKVGKHWEPQGYPALD